MKQLQTIFTICLSCLLLAGCAASVPPVVISGESSEAQSSATASIPSAQVAPLLYGGLYLEDAPNEESILAAVIDYGYYAYNGRFEMLGDVSEQLNVTQYVHDQEGQTFLIVPKHSGAVVTVRSLTPEGERLVAGETLATAEGEHPALLLRATLPESAPQIEITVESGGKSVVWQPSYNGKDGTLTLPDGMKAAAIHPQRTLKYDGKTGEITEISTFFGRDSYFAVEDASPDGKTYLLAANYGGELGRTMANLALFDRETGAFSELPVSEADAALPARGSYRFLDDETFFYSVVSDASINLYSTRTRDVLPLTFDLPQGVDAQGADAFFDAERAVFLVRTADCKTLLTFDRAGKLLSRTDGEIPRGALLGGKFYTAVESKGGMELQEYDPQSAQSRTLDLSEEGQEIPQECYPRFVADGRLISSGFRAGGVPVLYVTTLDEKPATFSVAADALIGEASWLGAYPLMRAVDGNGYLHVQTEQKSVIYRQSLTLSDDHEAVAELPYADYFLLDVDAQGNLYLIVVS